MTGRAIDASDLGKARVTALLHFLTLAVVFINAADVGDQTARLAFDIGTGIPGLGRDQ